MGARLFHRGGGLFPGHRASGGGRELAKPKGKFTIQIFATDLDRDAIDKARQGVFPANIAADVSEERLKRFFAKEERGYRVRKEIREMVIFAPQNLIMDPPFTKLDILSCRNLLIYLTPEVQKKLIPLFHYSLNPGGILFLGSAETIGGSTDLFAPLSGKSRLFRRTESSPATGAGRLSLVLQRGPARRARGTAGAQTAGQPPVPGGSVGPAALRPAGRARQ